MQEAFDQYMRDNGGYIVNIVTTNRTGMAGMSHSGAARAGTKEWIKYIYLKNQILGKDSRKKELS